MDHLAAGNIFVDFTPLELFRGNTFDLRTRELTPNKKPDLVTFEKSGIIYAKKRSGGLSLFDNIYPKYKAKTCRRIVSKTVIPYGLELIKDHQMDGYDIWHYIAAPRWDMPVAEYINLLETFAKFSMPVVGAK